MNQIKNYLKKSQENANFSSRKPYYQNFWQKFFSEPTITNATSPGKVCYCIMSEEDDDLIDCDNKNCQIKWFHLKCLRIIKIPKGRWFFPECRKAKKQKNNCSWIHVWFIIQGETGNKNFNVYMSVGVLGALGHDPKVEAIAFFPTFYFGITWNCFFQFQNFSPFNTWNFL